MGDGRASRDPAEDIHEDGFDIRIRENDPERFGDLLGVGTPADVEEVRGSPAVVLDDVHGRHGEPCPIDQATDVSFEFDEAQAAVGGSEFRGLFLGLIAQFLDIRMAIQRVVIEGDFPIEGDHLVVFGDHQRVDLGHRAIEFDKEVAKFPEENVRVFGRWA